MRTNRFLTAALVVAFSTLSTLDSSAMPGGCKCGPPGAGTPGDAAGGRGNAPSTGGGGGGNGGGSGGAAATPSIPKAPMSIATGAPRSFASRKLLELDWNHPIQARERSTLATAAEERRVALSREDALRIVAGDDPRPLLVLRECKVCNATDDALLTRDADNERTLVLARLFHCVKLPVDLVEPDHPFHALFPGDDSEHLFVALRDGSGKIALESDTSRVELWSSMERALAAAYAKEPAAIYKDVMAALEGLDRAEARASDAERRRDELMQTAGADLAKVKRLDVDAKIARKQASEAREKVKKAYAVPFARGEANAAALEKLAR